MGADSDMRAAVGQIPPGVEFPPVELVAAPRLEDEQPLEQVDRLGRGGWEARRE